MNLEGQVERKQLIHVIVNCAVTMATLDTLSKVEVSLKPEKEYVEKERDEILKMKNILKGYLNTDTNSQLEALYAVQIFCYEKEFPKGLIYFMAITKISFYVLHVLVEYDSCRISL